MFGGSAGHDWRAAKAARIDVELRELARGDGRVRLALGQALEEVARTRAYMALGFSSLEAFAKERLGLGAGVVRQHRAVARRLDVLPRLKKALTDGPLGFSMVELVARHATPMNEPFLVALAHHSTIERMRALLKDKPKPSATETACISRTVPIEVAWLFEQVRMLAAALSGTSSSDALFEALIAEGTTDLAPWLEGEPVPVDLPEPDPDTAPDSAALARPLDAKPTPLAPCEPTELDRRCVALARQLTGRVLRMAELTLDLEWLGGYPTTKADYAETVLGVSVSWLNDKQRLVRGLSRFPELGLALEDHRIGMEAATHLVRVVTQQSVEAWIERASRRTVKHLLEEIRLVEQVARLTGGSPAGPPTADQMARAEEVERGVLRGQISAAAEAPMPDDPTAVRPEQMGRVRLRFRIRRDLAAEFRRLERAWDKAGQPYGSFILFLSCSFLRAWEHIFDTEDREYEPIYARERYKCASPTCERRDLTPHHLIFRSQGGTDDADNVSALCTACHLQLIHTWGSAKAEPPATHMTWKTPVMQVEGREVVWRR